MMCVGRVQPACQSFPVERMQKAHAELLDNTVVNTNVTSTVQIHSTFTGNMKTLAGAALKCHPMQMEIFRESANIKAPFGIQSARETTPRQ